MEVPRYRSSLTSWRSFFLSSELLDKNASIRSKLPTAACWSWEITEENLKQTCFMSKAKATSVPQLGNHSQYSSHVGALNLINESKSLPVEANHSTIKLHLPVEAKEKIEMIDESKSLPVEANNSTIELHLAIEAKEKLSEYIESTSLPIEVKENFAIVNSKYGSLVEGNHSFPNSCFETNSESISPVKSIHSTLQSNFFSTFESKENFSSTTLNFLLLNNVEHSSKCFGPTERRFAGYEEQLDCDIYSINNDKRLQGLINANDTLNPCLSLCSALMNTFTTYKQAIVIFRNITLTILTESNGSFYTFDPHARNHDGMPNSNGTATVLKFGDLGELGTRRVSARHKAALQCFQKWRRKFQIFERRLGMSKVWYKQRVLVPSGKAVALHSQKNMVDCSFSFQKIPNMSWFCY